MKNISWKTKSSKGGSGSTKNILFTYSFKKAILRKKASILLAYDIVKEQCCVT